MLKLQGDAVQHLLLDNGKQNVDVLELIIIQQAIFLTKRYSTLIFKIIVLIQLIIQNMLGRPAFLTYSYFINQINLHSTHKTVINILRYKSISLLIHNS